MEMKNYCSWCLELTTHNLVDKGRLTRDSYKCSRCDRRTVKCRYCENMAQAKLSKETIRQSYDFDSASYLKKLNDAAIDHMLKKLRESPYRQPERPAYPDRRGMGIAEEDK